MPDHFSDCPVCQGRADVVIAYENEAMCNWCTRRRWESSTHDFIALLLAG